MEPTYEQLQQQLLQMQPPPSSKGRYAPAMIAAGGADTIARLLGGESNLAGGVAEGISEFRKRGVQETKLQMDLLTEQLKELRAFHKYQLEEDETLARTDEVKQRTKFASEMHPLQMRSEAALGSKRKQEMQHANAKLPLELQNLELDARTEAAQGSKIKRENQMFDSTADLKIAAEELAVQNAAAQLEKTQQEVADARQKSSRKDQQLLLLEDAYNNAPNEQTRNYAKQQYMVALAGDNISTVKELTEQGDPFINTLLQATGGKITKDTDPQIVQTATAIAENKVNPLISNTMRLAKEVAIKASHGKLVTQDDPNGTKGSKRTVLRDKQAASEYYRQVLMGTAPLFSDLEATGELDEFLYEVYDDLKQVPGFTKSIWQDRIDKMNRVPLTQVEGREPFTHLQPSIHNYTDEDVEKDLVPQWFGGLDSITFKQLKEDYYQAAQPFLRGPKQPEIVGPKQPMKPAV